MACLRDANPLRGPEIKGAARRTVRPKSREETPKEGNEVSEKLTNLARQNLDVRRTKRKAILLHCRSHIAA